MMEVRVGCKVSEMTSASRKAPRAFMYRNCTWLAMRHLGYSFPEIGKAATRDHSTIMSGVKDAEQRPGIRKLAREMAERVVAKYRD